MPVSSSPPQLRDTLGDEPPFFSADVSSSLLPCGSFKPSSGPPGASSGLSTEEGPGACLLSVLSRNSPWICCPITPPRALNNEAVELGPWGKEASGLGLRGRVELSLRLRGASSRGTSRCEPCRLPRGCA